ncbi:MAG: hypothetical protein MUF71_16760 [Candidatus Kapabacteria bacterium]|nr:hypothetical protein [Candidatus Kapabacteria bacterium]
MDATFAERMFVHYYRLYDRYERKIASIALLTDEHPAWQPRQYKQTTLCCTIQLDFSVAKMLDFAQDWQRLEETSNPFATVVMAHLKAQQTRQHPEERYNLELQAFFHIVSKKFSTARYFRITAVHRLAYYLARRPRITIQRRILCAGGYNNALLHMVGTRSH